LTWKDAQGLPTPQWTSLAKFESEVAPGSQTTPAPARCVTLGKIEAL